MTAQRAGGEAQVIWTNLGLRDPEGLSRAWLGVTRRPVDTGPLYLYSGGTAVQACGLLRWNASIERFEVEHPGVPTSSPWSGGTPPSVDNGWILYDAVQDELWVSCVNPWSVPGIYSFATRTWRQVTRAEFPTFDWNSLPGVFDAGCASNDRYMVVYGGLSDAGAMAHLWVGDDLAPPATRWSRLSDHGLGVGKPGPRGYIQMQFSWNADLGRFLLVAGAMAWTLDPAGWTWAAHPLAGSPPPGNSVSCLSRAGARQVVACGGATADIWFLDLTTWTWTQIASDGLPLPRWDGIAWIEGNTLYTAFGQNTTPGVFSRQLPPIVAPPSPPPPPPPPPPVPPPPPMVDVEVTMPIGAHMWINGMDYVAS